MILLCFKALWNQIGNWNPGPMLAVLTWASFFFLALFPHLLIGAMKNKWDYNYKALGLVSDYRVSDSTKRKLFLYFVFSLFIGLFNFGPSLLLSFLPFPVQFSLFPSNNIGYTCLCLPSNPMCLKQGLYWKCLRVSNFFKSLRETLNLSVIAPHYFFSFDSN